MEVVKIDDEPLFKTLKDENKSDKNESDSNESKADAVGDDEDVSDGSGSGDIQIEIEENPLIFNTTDDIKALGKYNYEGIYIVHDYYIICMMTASITLIFYLENKSTIYLGNLTKIMIISKKAHSTLAEN